MTIDSVFARLGEVDLRRRDARTVHFGGATPVTPESPLGVAVVGAGYWGPNLIRNFQASSATRLRVVCDLSLERATHAVGPYSTVRVTTELDDVLADPSVEAVAVATPARTHRTIALAALAAGKHVLVEKPLASSVTEGLEVVEAAASRGLTLMCDHTYCYTPTVQRIRELIRAGDLGDLQYVDSVRINLGLIQPDIDVFWDLAPHDLSILDFILPDGCRIEAVAAMGADPLDVGRSCIGYLTLPLSGGGVAHAHVNWLSPTKMRTTIIGGSRRMLVWDDLNPSQRLTMFDKGVDLTASLNGDNRRDRLISYRAGDMVAPALREREALQGVVGEFAAAVRERRAPMTDGRAGLRVLEILETAAESRCAGGAAVAMERTHA